jgi:hypothetical protein
MRAFVMAKLVPLAIACAIFAACLALGSARGGKAKTTDKAFQNMHSYARGRVVQPSVRSAPQKSGTSPRIRQGWPSKVHW